MGHHPQFYGILVVKPRALYILSRQTLVNSSPSQYRSLWGASHTDNMFLCYQGKRLQFKAELGWGRTGRKFTTEQTDIYYVPPLTVTESWGPLQKCLTTTKL